MSDTFVTGDAAGISETSANESAKKVPHNAGTTTVKPKHDKEEKQYFVNDEYQFSSAGYYKWEADTNVDPLRPRSTDTVWDIDSLILKVQDRVAAMQAAPILPWDEKNPTMYLHPLCVPWAGIKERNAWTWLACSACRRPLILCQHIPKGLFSSVVEDPMEEYPDEDGYCEAGMCLRCERPMADAAAPNCSNLNHAGDCTYCGRRCSQGGTCPVC